MQLYLLRHGLTEYNTQKRYQGWRDISLSPAGRADLVRADFNPDVVYISPLSRAGETARILFPEAKLQVVEGLKEMNFGIFEGRTYVEMEHDPDYLAWVGENGEGKIPGGESKAEFCDRACRTVAGLIDGALAAGEPRLVILAHGGTQMAAMERFALPHKEYYSWCGPNAGGFLCGVDPSVWRAGQTFTFLKTVQYTRPTGENG